MRSVDNILKSTGKSRKEKASAVLRYLSDCYRADRRLGGIANLFDKKLQPLFFSGREELLSGELQRLPLDGEEYESIAKAAALYLRERSLRYFAFPVTGSVMKGERKTRICAPLLTWPASLTPCNDESGLMWLELSYEDQQPNIIPLGDMLGGESESAGALETMLAELPSPPFGPDAIFEISSLLSSVFPSLDSSSLMKYPLQSSEKELRQAVSDSTRNAGEFCLPACGLVLVENSLDTRGISHELSILSAANPSDFSSPLFRLLTGLDEDSGSELIELQSGSGSEKAGKGSSSGTGKRGRTEKKPAENHRPLLPAILSKAQEKALYSAAFNELSLVIGPPGTGKSYTVAAIALERLCAGETVLMSARSPQALDVLTEKVGAILGADPPVLRVGGKSQMRDVAGMIEGLLHGRNIGGSHREDKESSAFIKKKLAVYDRQLDLFEKKLIQRAGMEIQWGEAETDSAKKGIGAFWSSVRHSFNTRRIERLPEYWSLLEEYETLLHERAQTVSGLLQALLRERMDEALSKHRKSLKLFCQALRARKSSRQEHLFSGIDLADLIHVLPLWVSSFSDIHRAIPFQPEIFDIVIIDEATQCDMATCLPVIQRARRIVVTGDPKQLRHVSFLRESRRRLLLEKQGLDIDDPGLDYREKSLLDRVSDLTGSRDQSVFLDEHFRSHPHLISFSNRHFYHDALRIMTERPPVIKDERLLFRRVQGRREGPGHNTIEALALVEELLAVVEREKNLPPESCHSIGVLSPFRDQVDLLSGLLSDRLTLNSMERHSIRVETAYGFQGEERDLMFISFALDSDSPAAAFRYLERADVFNVSITRARSMQYIYTSFSPDQKIGGTLLRRFLESSFEHIHTPYKNTDPFADEVSEALVSRGFSVWPAFPVAGDTVDLLAVRGGINVAIDLIGYPGAFADAFELERCRISRRAGLRIFPLSLFAWRKDPERCLDALEILSGSNPVART